MFRRIRAGELERVDPAQDINHPSINDNPMSDIMTVINPRLRVVGVNNVGLMTDNDRHKAVGNGGADREEIHSLRSQLREKDVQIAQLMRTQGQLNETIQKLQDQLFEMSHLILSHHVEMEQARLKADLERTNIESNKSRLSRLLGKL